MSTSLLLSDLLKNNGIDPKEVVLVRHVLNREDFNNCFNAGYVKEYTQIQHKNSIQAQLMVIKAFSVDGASTLIHITAETRNL